LAVCGLTLAFAGDLAGWQDPAEIGRLLDRTGAYILRQLTEASSIVAEEDYIQRASGSGGQGPLTRRLKSDVALILDDRVGWLVFRDIVEVDGRPLREREERLSRLFTEPDALARAKRMVAEGARFNLSPAGTQFDRTINVPGTSLRFLIPRNQRRSDFQVRWVTMNGRRMARLLFAERERPRLIASPDNAAASGSATIDPETGAVWETVLSIRTGSIDASVRTTYGPVPSFTAYMPLKMEEVYVLGLAGAQMNGPTVDGTATYRNFRSFRVSVDTTAAGSDR